MSWKESVVRSERIAFVVRARQRGCNMAALCRVNLPWISGHLRKSG